MGLTIPIRSSSALLQPERYRELKLLARPSMKPQAGCWKRGWHWKAMETPGESSGLYAWELSAARDLAPMLRLRLYAAAATAAPFCRAREAVTLGTIWRRPDLVLLTHLPCPRHEFSHAGSR